MKTLGKSFSIIKPFNIFNNQLKQSHQSLEALMEMTWWSPFIGCQSNESGTMKKYASPGKYDVVSILTLKPRPISTSASTGNVKSRLETTKLFVHAQST